MAHHTAGMYFGGDSGEEDGGFDFGDSDTRESFPEEPTLASIVTGNSPQGQRKGSAGEGRSSGDEDRSDGGTPSVQDRSAAVGGSSEARRTGGFGLPPRLANRNAAGGETLGGARRVRRRRRDGGGGLGGGGDGDVGSRGRALKVGEDLRLAITRGNVDEVRRIFDGGFDPNTPLKSGWTALMYACDAGNDKMVEVLLDHGANPNTQKDMFTALMAVCCSQYDREEVLVGCARVLVNKGARVNAHDRHHMSPLMYACQKGRQSLAQLLLSTNADINKQDTRGWTPLFYAASLGNARLIQTLLDAHAHVEIMCNLGDTAANVAYAHGHTAVVDLLEGPSVKPQDDAHSLPPHPLLSGAGVSGDGGTEAMGESAHQFSSGKSQPFPEAPPRASDSECVRYGDLELFLLGLQLGDLLPQFQTHKIKFADLLSMTDRDLEQVGVSQVGVRKRILDGILEIHKKQWKMPKDILPYNKSISPAEATVILAHLAQHARYICGTATFLLTQATASSDMLDPNMEVEEAEKLTNELSEAVLAVSSLQTEVQALNSHVHKAIGRELTAKKTTFRSSRVAKGLKVVAVAGSAVAIIVGAYFAGRALIRKWPLGATT